MRSPFYQYCGWLIYWEPVDGCYFAKQLSSLSYVKFGTDAGLSRVCDHIRQRSLAGRVGT